MSDPRDYKLDIAGLTPADAPGASGGAASRDATPRDSATRDDVKHGGGRSGDTNSPREGRPYLRVLFKCCNVYQRVYRSPTGDTYDARCPRCTRTARFKVAPGGTDAREFVLE